MENEYREAPDKDYPLTHWVKRGSTKTLCGMRVPSPRSAYLGVALNYHREPCETCDEARAHEQRA